MVNANVGRGVAHASKGADALFLVSRLTDWSLRTFQLQNGLLLQSQSCTPLCVGVAHFECLGRRSGQELVELGCHGITFLDVMSLAMNTFADASCITITTYCQ